MSPIKRTQLQINRPKTQQNERVAVHNQMRQRIKGSMPPMTITESTLTDMKFNDHPFGGFYKLQDSNKGSIIIITSWEPRLFMHSLPYPQRIAHHKGQPFKIFYQTNRGKFESTIIGLFEHQEFVVLPGTIFGCQLMQKPLQNNFSLLSIDVEEGYDTNKISDVKVASIPNNLRHMVKEGRNKDVILYQGRRRRVQS